MISDFSLQHLRFHLEPKAPLHMPAHNKGSTLRPQAEGQCDSGFGSNGLGGVS